MTVLIDSWAWIEYFKGTRSGARVRTYIEGDEDAIVSAVNVAEVYRWFLKDHDEPAAEDGRSVLRARATIVPLDESIAVAAALARHVHRWGLGDAVVYATARARDARILTGDPDFKKLPDTIFIGNE